MSAKPTTKSSGLAFRQARMEGPAESRSRGTDDPRLRGLPGAGPVGGSAGPGTSGPSAKATAQGGQAKGMSLGKTKGQAQGEAKYGSGPGGIGLSGRGAPIT